MNFIVTLHVIYQNWKQPKYIKKQTNSELGTIVHLYSIIIFNNKKERIPNTCNDIGDSQKHIRRERRPNLVWFSG